MLHLHKPNSPITHLYKIFPNGVNCTPQYMVGYSDGTSVDVPAAAWREMLDVSGATWDAATASYWVSGVDTSDPMTDNPTDEAEAFGARW